MLRSVPVPPSARLELRLLGPVELCRGGVLVDDTEWRRERVRSLLAYLALHRTASRTQIADDLWPSLDPHRQSRNLRVTLTYLLRVLEPDRGPRRPAFLIRQHGKNLLLHPGGWLRVDVWDFDAHCDEASRADREQLPGIALSHTRRAMELWRGEPTEVLSGQWGVVRLEQRRVRFAATATRAAELLLARHELDEALALAERALAVDPWVEAAHRLVVAAHRTNHNELAARRALQRFRDTIDELGLDPAEASLMAERLWTTSHPDTTASA